MHISTVTLEVFSKDGENLGHVCDAVRNLPEFAAEAKGLLDRAWLEREAEHSEAVADIHGQYGVKMEALRTEIKELREKKDADIQALKQAIEQAGGLERLCSIAKDKRVQELTKQREKLQAEIESLSAGGP